MVASLIHVCEAAGMSRPHILFWGHEPRPVTGWTNPGRVGAYVDNTAKAQGLRWRVPDAPFVMESFCMGDHGVVSGYRANATRAGRARALVARNDAAEAWGLRLCRSTLYEFCAALDFDGSLPGDDVRPLMARSWTRSGAIPPGPRHSPGEPVPTTATRPGPPYARSPGHSQNRIAPPAAAVLGSRDH